MRLCESSSLTWRCPYGRSRKRNLTPTCPATSSPCALASLTALRTVDSDTPARAAMWPSVRQQNLLLGSIRRCVGQQWFSWSWPYLHCRRSGLTAALRRRVFSLVASQILMLSTIGSPRKILIIRRHYQPKAATFERRSIPSALVQRISGPTDARNTADATSRCCGPSHGPERARY